MPLSAMQDVLMCLGALPSWVSATSTVADLRPDTNGDCQGLSWGFETVAVVAGIAAD